MRTRQFSDISVAESCIDTHRRCKVLMKRQAAIDYLNTNDITDILNDVNVEFDNVSVENILIVVEYLFMMPALSKKKQNMNEFKTIIIELLGELIDNTFKYQGVEYTELYRPILKHIIPQYIDKLYDTNINIRKRRIFCCF